MWFGPPPFPAPAVAVRQPLAERNQIKECDRTKLKDSKPVKRYALVLAAFLGAAWLLSSAVDSEKLWHYRNLGKAYYEDPTKKNEAVGQFKKALELAPNSFRERLNYGLALMKADELEAAIVELEKAQKQDPAIPHTWFNLGIAYKKERRYEDAVKQFEQMAKLVPDEPVTHYNLGLMYAQLGKEDLALKEYAKAIQIDPKMVAPRAQTFTIHRLAGREKESDQAREAFLKSKELQKQWDESEDMDWSWYAEIYDPIDLPTLAMSAVPPVLEPKKLADDLDAATSGLAVLDLTGQGKTDLIAWSKTGIKLFKDGETLTDVGLGAAKGVRSVAVGDVDNDGLPDLILLDSTGAWLAHNNQGKFEKPVMIQKGWFNGAVWLDYDHDYDLDLVLLGEKPMLLRNDGDNKFSDHTSDFPFVAGHATAGIPLRVVSDSKGSDLLVLYGDRPAVLYRDELRAQYKPETLERIPASTTSVRAYDVDNDGWLDLIFAAPGGAGVLKNVHGKTFEPSQSFAKSSADAIVVDFTNSGRGEVVAAWSPAMRGMQYGIAALAEADFDGDGQTDVAVVGGDGSLTLLANWTKTKNYWLDVVLQGVKNAKLAFGTEVEVKAGASYQKKVYHGVPLSFGVGGRNMIDTVRITWPNGLIQNQMEQKTNETIHVKEAPKLSGSCPMIFTWNGSHFEFVTDVLGVAPLGASSGDGKFFPVDHDEYVQIPAESLVARNGRYDVRITEELSEVTYLDHVRLIAVDHPENVEIYTNDKWKSPPFPEFRLFGVTKRIYPLTAADGEGHDVRDTLLRRDRVYAAGFRRDYAGVAETHALEMDFGRAGGQSVLVMNGWVDWADGSTFLAASQRKGGELTPPYLQVKDARGRWKTVINDLGMPSGKTKTIAVDLTEKWLSSSRAVRIVTNLCVYWDEVFLSEGNAAPQARLADVARANADLHFRGFSKPVIHPERKQPEYFDYTQVSALSSWNPTPGLYTRYGKVGELIDAIDDRLVVMGSGDELKLSFDAASLPALQSGWKRDFLLLVDGWAKDRDANTAYSQTVEPLPFHAMSVYPYPANERFPESRESSLREWNTRPASVLVQPLR